MKILLLNGKTNLIVLVLLTFLLIYITGQRILTVEFYSHSDSDLSGIPGQDIRIYEFLQQWIYISSFFYLLIKLGLISLVLHTACYLYQLDVSFGDTFKVAVLSEFVFLVPAFFKLVFFPLTYPHGTLLDWHHYYFLSALSLFPDAPADWSYALQTLNLFEVAYWFILAWGIRHISKLNFDTSLRLVLLSYLPALMIWIAAVTFFTLVMFPATG